MGTAGAQLEKSWNSTCRILFGSELGRLEDYREWLSGYLPKKARRKSHLSGKEVAVAMDAYPDGARFVSADELEMNKDYRLGINQIKDIDSILAGLREKCEYAGNRHLGNSTGVENSDIVIDSQNVRDSTNIEESQCVESSFMIRKGSKNIFGCGMLGAGEFLVRVADSLGQKRSFECSMVGMASDCYFCHNVLSSRDMMFCFGIRNKNCCIANSQLPKEKYLSLKAKILGEVAEVLKREKSFPSLAELVPDAAGRGVKIHAEPPAGLENMKPIEDGFASTYGILLKRNPGSIKDYERWLAQRNVSVRCVATPFGGKTYVPENLPVFADYPKKRIVTMRESLELGQICADGKVDGLQAAIDSLGEVGYFTPELADGQNANLISFPHAFNVVNAYNGHDGVYGEHIGMSSFALNSKHVYGCYRVLESQFSMKCFNSQYLNRCFELDSCNKCSDSYFCHNSEALSECMFCFSLKGRRYAIGNTELARDKYTALKGAVLSQISGELERKKSLGISIFDLGAASGSEQD